MLIDPLAIKFSPARSYRVVNADQNSVIQGLHDAMIATGWTLADSYFPTSTITYAFGYPTVTGVQVSFPKRQVSCSTVGGWITVGALSFTLFDPFNEEPVPGSPCGFIAMATTQEQGLQNAADAIAAVTNFDATFSDFGHSQFTLNLRAKTAGPLFNFVVISADGRFGIASDADRSVGGGYKMTSAVGASQYSVTMTARRALANILFTFSLFGSSGAVYAILQNGETAAGPATYALAVNGYGFAILDGIDNLSVPGWAVSLFCMAPYQPFGDGQVPPNEIFTGDYAVFIAGPRSFRYQTYWNGPDISTCIAADANTYSNSGGWPRILAFRAPSVPLTTPSGVPIIIGAYVQFGAGPSSGANVIGKLWDCAIVHDLVEGIRIINGQRFLPISAQSGASAQTGSTLMMCIPPANIHTSGRCNFLSGIAYLTSGDVWTSDMIGGPITVAGIPYVVTDFFDSVTIRLNLDTVHVADVPWTIP